jgi:cytochrome c
MTILPHWYFSKGFLGFLLFVIFHFASSSGKIALQPQNHPPQVKILTPKDDSIYHWNNQIPFKISVSDKEDGESKYDEINPKEVLLEIKKTEVGQTRSKEKADAGQEDPLGLFVMRRSNCLNCHSFEANSIGPSFLQISNRYPATETNFLLLAKRIREGSSGIWGKPTMPSHPELTTQETKSVAQWILYKANDPSIQYCVGTEGSFWIHPRGGDRHPSNFELTASYVDHGQKNDSSNRLKGTDRISIKCR